MSAGVEVREAFDRLAQAAKDFNTDEGLEAVDEDYRLVGGALAEVTRLSSINEVLAGTAAALTAQLQAAQAAIKAHNDGLISDCYDIDADLSALAEHDKQVAAKAWDEGYEFNMQLWEDGSYANPVNPYRASIEQTEAK